LTSGADHLLAAGRVADPAPPGKSGIHKSAEKLSVLGESNSQHEWGPDALLAVKTTQSSWVDIPRIARLSWWTAETLTSAARINPLLEVRDGWIFVKDAVSPAKDVLIKAAQTIISKNPCLKGITAEQLGTTARIPAEIAKRLVLDLCESGQLLRRDGLVMPPDATRQWAPAESRIVDVLAAAFASTNVHAHTLLELKVDTPAGRKVLRAVIDDGKAVRLSDRHFMGIDSFRRVATQVADFLSQHGPRSTAEIRDHLGIGRKLLILVIETMDRLGYTQRDGDNRSLSKSFPRGDDAVH
jgi:selenocysteine-specific elongation factor